MLLSNWLPFWQVSQPFLAEPLCDDQVTGPLLSPGPGGMEIGRSKFADPGHGVLFHPASVWHNQQNYSDPK